MHAQPFAATVAGFTVEETSVKCVIPPSRVTVWNALNVCFRCRSIQCEDEDGVVVVPDDDDEGEVVAVWTVPENVGCPSDENCKLFPMFSVELEEVEEIGVIVIAHPTLLLWLRHAGAWIHGDRKRSSRVNLFFGSTVSNPFARDLAAGLMNFQTSPSILKSPFLILRIMEDAESSRERDVVKNGDLPLSIVNWNGIKRNKNWFENRSTFFINIGSPKYNH